MTWSVIRNAQLLLAGANSGQLSHKDIYVFSKSYVACLDYNDVQVPMCLPWIPFLAAAACCKRVASAAGERQWICREGTCHVPKST